MARFTSRFGLVLTNQPAWGSAHITSIANFPAFRNSKKTNDSAHLEVNTAGATPVYS